tara:strand:+ start:310 stop:513 length:204 start_codon:yes stop_codon:yes gene_type:complete
MPITAEQYEANVLAFVGYRKIKSNCFRDLCKPTPETKPYKIRVHSYDFWAESWADAKASMAQESGGS